MSSEYSRSRTNPALPHPNKTQAGMEKDLLLVSEKPAMMKPQFIKPPKNAATPTNAPRIRPAAMANSPKIITLENQVWACAVTKNSMKLRYQSKVITGLGVILRPRCQNSSKASPEPIHLGSMNLCQPASNHV